MSADVQELLREFRPEHIDRARRHFASLPADEAVAGLRALGRDDDPQVRSYAVIFAGELFPAHAGPIAAQLLADADPSVRWQACADIAGHRHPAAVDQLAALAEHDPADFVRHMAAVALGGVGGPSAIPVLERAMQTEQGADNEGEPIRAAMARAVERIRSRRLAAGAA